mgnify:FL=1|tara:strand:+ start:1444 stop:3462 length:2019 start_codon:yes stop_codon:yes gene_type:complete
MLSLKEIPGVGDSLAEKLIFEIGSLADVERVIRDGDVSALSGIEGISPQRAVKLINSANNNISEITTTDEGRRLHKNLIASISDYVITKAAKERLSILTPLTRNSVVEIESRRSWSINSMRFINESQSSFELWRKCISGLGYTKESTSRIDRVIVVPNTIQLENLRHIEKKCRILVRSNDETWEDYLGLNRVTWIGEGGPKKLPSGWIIGEISDSLYDLVPEVPLEWLKINSDNLSILAELYDQVWPINAIGQTISEHLEGFNDLALLLQSLENESSNLENLERIRDNLWNQIKSIEESVNDAIVSGTSQSQLSFDGDEVLSYYSDISGLERRLKSTIEDTIDFALQEGRRKLDSYLENIDINLPNDIFSSEYPCVVNRDILELIDCELEKEIKSERSQGEIAIASSTVNIMKQSRKAISKFIEIDMWIGVGNWGISNRCTMPEMCISNPGIWMKDGRHLLLGCEPDAVTYGIGEVSPEDQRDKIALLSGANSGGKTTLLETLASLILLSHSGLPVPASYAKIGLLDELHIMAKVSGTQSAGALERTLKKLADILVSSERKIILADELEAITEPGAASLILGGLLKSSRYNNDTNILLVTHIGSSISEVMGGDIRIDGIEAQGLDENMDLIVDRNPKRNHIARSTPELIVRRLASRSKGPTSEIFSNLLKGF